MAIQKTVVTKESPTPPVRRTFSASFKQQKVEQIERKLISVAQVSAEFAVSPSAVYKWIDKFGTAQKSHRVVVELQSEEHRSRQLRDRLCELERGLGRKTIEVDYLTAIIETASAELGIDLKKTFGTTPSRLSVAAEHREAGR